MLLAPVSAARACPHRRFSPARLPRRSEACRGRPGAVAHRVRAAEDSEFESGTFGHISSYDLAMRYFHEIISYTAMRLHLGESGFRWLEGKED